MNYYPFHLGDYASHTAHLEPMEDLAYRRLLDQYYLREDALPADIQATAKLVRMRSMIGDVESVLREFFVLTETGWRHARCDDEIGRMIDKQVKAKASAAASVKARLAAVERAAKLRETNATENNNERSTNVQEKQPSVELPTPTPTPTPTPKVNQGQKQSAPRFDAQAHLLSLGVDPVIAADWLKLRKTKKADASLTAISGIAAEAEKAGYSLPDALRECCARGWAGFKAGWLLRDNPAQIVSWQDKKQAADDATNKAIREFGMGDIPLLSGARS